jgi:hypothetical protein
MSKIIKPVFSDYNEALRQGEGYKIKVQKKAGNGSDEPYPDGMSFVRSK